MDATLPDNPIISPITLHDLHFPLNVTPIIKKVLRCVVIPFPVVLALINYTESYLKNFFMQA